MNSGPDEDVKVGDAAAVREVYERQWRAMVDADPSALADCLAEGFTLGRTRPPRHRPNAQPDTADDSSAIN